jgi:hypothetical protein
MRDLGSAGRGAPDLGQLAAANADLAGRFARRTAPHRDRGSGDRSRGSHLRHLSPQHFDRASIAETAGVIVRRDAPSFRR